MRLHPLAALFIVSGLADRATAQSAAPLPVTTVSYGTLNQNDLALRVRTEDVEIRFVPLDAKVTRLLANDAFQSLRSLVETRRRSIDLLDGFEVDLQNDRILDAQHRGDAWLLHAELLERHAG